MAYHEGPVDQVRARIRSTRGETIDLALPDSCTVGELRSFLIEEYQYNPNTRLLFNNAPAPDASAVTSFPYGSLLIATPADMTELARQQPQAAAPAASTQASGRGVGQAASQAAQPAAARTAPVGNESPGKQTRIPQHQSHMAAQLHRNHAQAAPASTHQPPARDRSRSTEEEKATAPARAAQSTTLKPPPKTAVPNAHQNSLPLRRGSTANSTGENPAAAATPQSAYQPATQQQQQQQQQQPAQAPAEPAPRGPMPPPEPTAATSPYPQQASAHASPPPPQQPPQQPPQRPPSQTATPAPASQEQTEASSAAVDFSHWREISFKVECVIPALGRVAQLAVTADCSVAALAVGITDAVPALRGTPFSLVLRGKVLQQTENNILFNLGMRSDCRVYVASGNYSSIDAIVLLEIKEQLTTIETAMGYSLTQEKRKGYYEELMRMLLRTDGLQDLEGEWRQKRKETVAQIVRLQDSLRVTEAH